MKGIILAGGNGTRLYPTTRIITKQLLPVYDKPMIYYPLTTLILAGIKEILIITTPSEQHLYEKLLGDGSAWGLSLTYATQAEPKGIAQAYLIAEDFINNELSCLILGDNILYGDGVIHQLREASQLKKGGAVFSYYVNDPERYGVVEFDTEKKPKRIVEKPKHYVSNHAVIGLYVYDAKAIDYAKTLTPSGRNELEITDISNRYLEEGELHVYRLGRGIAWLDTGTLDSLVDASHYVEVCQKRQALKIGCPEEAAWRQGLIDNAQLRELAKPIMASGYGQYLLTLLERE